MPPACVNTRGPTQEVQAPMYEQDYALPVLARFWSKVDVPADLDACWLWQASRPNGYGQFGVRAGDLRRSHRYAYEHLHGPIAPGLHLDHLCRTPRCVNPWHLEPVTPAEHARRALSASKTHCVNGHAYDDGNLYVDPRGRRQCKLCRRAATQRSLTKTYGSPAAYWRARRAGEAL
jgi:hypothetical protein